MREARPPADVPDVLFHGSVLSGEIHGFQESEELQVVRLISCDQKYRTVLEGSGLYPVHSVYRSTLNIDLGGRILTLQPSAVPRTPLSAVLDCGTEEFCIIAEAAKDVRISDGFLKVGDNTIVLSDTDYYSSRLEDSSVASFRLKRTILRVLSGRKSESFFWCLYPDLIGKSSRFSGIREASEILKSSENDLTQLVRLIGLGLGLTPSGDDFLIGVLYGLALLDKKAELRTLAELVRSDLKKTNTISAEFLAHACDGEYSAPLLAIAGCGKMCSDEQLSRCVKEAAAVGHSSGSDTLAGIFWTLAME